MTISTQSNKNGARKRLGFFSTLFTLLSLIFLSPHFAFLEALLEAPLIDLEANLSPFVVGIKKIEIPGYPTACNPSVVRSNGQLWMSFRVIDNPIPALYSYSGLADSAIGVVRISDQFNPIGKPSFLATKADSTLPSMPQDPRLILLNNKVYMVYSDNATIEHKQEGVRVYIAGLNLNKKEATIDFIDCIDKFEQDDRFPIEKNWVPFIYKNDLLLAYSLIPHRILDPAIGQGRARTIHLTRTKIEWPWGELRGGTPALALNNKSNLAFFHSVLPMASVQSKGKIVPHYFIGAYLFSDNPPFNITHISSEPIVAKGFYSGFQYPPYWKPVQVIFPGGYFIEGDSLWLFYGRQDNEIWVAEIDLKGLLNSLTRVKTRLAN